jgi:hypothetical protein
MAFQSTKCILDPHVFFEQASQLEPAGSTPAAQPDR